MKTGIDYRTLKEKALEFIRTKALEASAKRQDQTLLILDESQVPPDKVGEAEMLGTGEGKARDQREGTGDQETTNG